MIIKLTVSYDGTDFCGWQTQNNGVSVQAVLENALQQIIKKPVKITGSGRTDAGVHAQGQVASFETESSIPPSKFALALNPLLPDSVKVIKSERAKEGFNARKTAKRKTYVYTFYKSKTALPLKERYAVMLDKQVDKNLMESASKIFIGTHDFKCFNASGGGAKTTVRTVYSIKIKDGKTALIMEFCGNGFLYKMVRSMAGAILLAGQKEVLIKDLKQMLESGKKCKNYKTLPAKGLCLKKVEY